VARTDDGDPRLTRFVINCCAADGATVQASLDSERTLPKDGTWVEVTGQLIPDDPTTTSADGDAPEPPTIRVDSYHEIDEPDLPYEFPYSRIG
jgi:uncharacterized membrane protein YcgQ (UPF0703/DUF1980 family)